MKVEFSRVISDPWLLLATGFGSGLAPRAPGTAGSVVGLLLFIPALYLPVYVQLGLVIVAAGTGIRICGQAARVLGVKDPAIIVWDEFVGMWISLLLLPSLLWLPVAFILFRLFDIAKPWPVSWADTHLEGGPGIMMDDVIAGVLALGSLQLLHFVYVSYL